MDSTQPESGPARIARVHGVAVVEIVGRLDVISAPLLDAQTASLFSDPCDRLLLDLSATSYISSAGLRSILKIIKMSAARSGRVGMFGISEHILEILEISGFQSLMDMYPNRETALKECVPS